MGQSAASSEVLDSVQASVEPSDTFASQLNSNPYAVTVAPGFWADTTDETSAVPSAATAAQPTACPHFFDIGIIRFSWAAHIL